VAGASTTYRPTSKQLGTDISAAVKVTKPPSLATTIPPLASLNPAVDATLLGVTSACYSQTLAAVPPNAGTLCAWGDRTTKRTIYLFGDSQAAMWLPALNPIAVALKYKIVMVARSGCPPWPDQSPYGYAGDYQPGCVSFVNSELAYLRVLKPAVVIPAGDGFHDGQGVYPTIGQLVASYRKLIAMAMPAKSVLLSPIPMYTLPQTYYTPGTCLVTASNIQSCEYPPSKMVNQAFDAAGRAAAKASSLRYVVVTPLFCTTSRCSLVVKDHGNHLVYVDGKHANRFYMDWISGAFGALLKPAL